MKITIVGTGYVGLVSGACLSDFGHQVVCVDKNLERIQDLKKGIIPIYEHLNSINHWCPGPDLNRHEVSFEGF